MPNRARTKHWRSNATAAALHKSLVAIELHQQGIGKVDCERVSLTLRFCPPDQRRRDLHGLYGAFKAAEDMIAQAIGLDDYFFEPVTLCRGPVYPKGRVLVTICEE